MDRDLDPALESAARRRLTALADAIAVRPAIASEAGGPDAGRVRPGSARRPRHRPMVLVGAGAVGLVAGVMAAVALSGDGASPRTVTATSSPRSPGACQPRVAGDGVVAAGPIPGGGRWEVRVQGEPPNDSTSVFVDDEKVGGTWGDELSRAPVVNDGVLGLHAGVTEEGGIVYGQVPLATDAVEVRTEDGDVVRACPVTVPTDDLVGYFGAALPPGSRPVEARALDAEGRMLASGDLSQVGLDVVPSAASTHMTVDRSLVPLPLGGSEVEVPPRPVLTDILSGELPGGTWSLAAGPDDEAVVLELRLPDGGGAGLQGTPAQLAGADTAWSVQVVDGRLLTWGPVPPEVATVTVSLEDGTTVDLPTVETVPDAPVRAFAATLPEGSTITGIEGRRADGSAVLRAVDVAEQMAHLSGPDPVDGTSVLVVPAE